MRTGPCQAAGVGRAAAVGGTLLLATLTACGGEPAPQVRAVPVVSSAPTPSPSASPTPAPTPVVRAGDGDLDVVAGTSAVSGTGDVVAYVVEVEGGLGVDPTAFAQAVERTLADPRSWTAGGRRALQRVDDADRAEVRVALASPETADRLCAPLDTGGWFSCANGERAVLNSARWLTGAPSYADRLADYRDYLVNHEVGHVLGFGHERCPGPGERAPVMLQQTKGLDGCAPNAWPYP